MKDATASEICDEMDSYLKYARVAYVQMRDEHLSGSDHVIDGTKKLEDIIDEAVKIILNC